MNSNSIVNLSSSSGSNPFHEAATAMGVEGDLHGMKMMMIMMRRRVKCQPEEEKGW